MTLRLIALMSSVLLLSLAVLALLMGHFQHGVMTELENTVSMVGKETIRSLEGPLPDPGIERSPAATPPGRRVHRLRIRHEAGNVILTEDDKQGQVIALSRTAGEVAAHGVSERVWLRTESVRSGEAQHAEIEQLFVVHLEDVKTETDPARGLLLRIPTRKPLPPGDKPLLPGEEPVSSGDKPAGAPLQRTAAAIAGFEREILLPIPTAHYQALFAGMRKKSALVFLAVFAVGTALSATVASRFTRPIRKLDAGIRRLSAGDLEVTVDVRGEDEVGRLGRAFNEMAEELRRARDRARELTRKEKLSALGRLASGVAHDVRNPLHSIGLTLQHIHETCRPEDAARGREFDRSLDLIRAEIRRLDRLVSNFLSFARSDRQERGPVDLPELVRDVARLIEKEAERRGVVLRVAAEDQGRGGKEGPGTDQAEAEDVAVVRGDAGAIRAAVLNLVLNSFEAMEQGGELRLTVDAAPGEVRLAVADTGRGIPQAEQDKVFEFAYSTREGGTGLGLAMVHQVVVEDHGGRVRLESAPGEGTCVTLGFPRAATSGRPA